MLDSLEFCNLRQFRPWYWVFEMWKTNSHQFFQRPILYSNSWFDNILYNFLSIWMSDTEIYLNIILIFKNKMFGKFISSVSVIDCLIINNPYVSWVSTIQTSNLNEDPIKIKYFWNIMGWWIQKLQILTLDFFQIKWYCSGHL